MDDLLDELLAVSPFAPLTVHLADGRFFYVDHPDFAIARQHGALAIYLNSNRVAHVSFRHVVSMETTQVEPRV